MPSASKYAIRALPLFERSFNVIVYVAIYFDALFCLLVQIYVFFLDEGVVIAKKVAEWVKIL